MRGDRRAAVLLLVGVLTACAPAAPATPPPSPTPTPPPDPVTVCTNQLTYWAGEQLRGAPDGGLDYQEMGLTGAQAEALTTLVAEARAGGDRPPDWLPTRARALCTDIAEHPRPAGGGWP